MPKKCSFLAFSLLLLLAISGLGQTPTEEILLTNQDVQGAYMTAGSGSQPIYFLADPTSEGGDLVDVMISDAAVNVTLVLADGREITAANAESNGFEYAAIESGALANSNGSLPFPDCGTHLTFKFPGGLVPGTYHVNVDATGTVSDAVAVVTYISSSSVRAALTTGKISYWVGETVVLSALLIDGSSPIIGANIIVAISDPAQTEVAPIELTLLDSGESDVVVGDGLYTAVFTPDHSGEFIVAMRATGASTSAVNFARVASTALTVTSPLASFTSFENAGVDDDANNLIDRITVTAHVDVQKAGDYQLTARLVASNESEIKTTTVVSVPLGPQDIVIAFSAKEIRSLEVDGPYDIKDAILVYRSDLDVPVADYRADAGSTGAYALASLDSFEKADISVTSSAFPRPVRVGELLTYTLGVYNVGTASSSGVVLTDQLPGGATFSSAGASQGSCSQTSPLTLTCDLGYIELAASATVTIVVVPTATGTLTNTANVSNVTAESNANNNTTTLDTLVISPPATSAAFVATDGTTQGNWKGAYGADGYYVINDSQNYPGYAVVSATNHHPYSYTNSTNEIRALQNAVGAERIASGWYSSGTFTVDLDLTDGEVHRVALYVMDWDLNGRAERIEILDASNGAVLDSQTVIGYSHGKYLIWKVRGHIKINVTNMGPFNGVINGLFFDPEATPPPAVPTYTLSGVVKDSGGNPLSGAALALSGYASYVTTTGSDGSYTIPSLVGGQDYTVTPSGPYAPFFPSDRAISYLAANENLDFTGTLALESNGKIAFTVANPQSRIHIMNGDGTGRRNIHPLTASGSHSPAWSPDGSRILFLDEVYENGSRRNRMYVMNADGTDVREILYAAFYGGEQYLSPVWSPDGRMIAFISNLHEPAVDRYHLYVMNANGTNVTKLSSGRSAGIPSWSPDSTRLVFEDTTDDNQYLITSIKIDGTSRTVLFSSYDSDPVWSPDGATIAFASNLDLYVMNVDGSNQRRLTVDSSATRPVWSPDSSKLAFRSNLGSYSDRMIVVMNADGTNQTNITQAPGDNYDPAWSPDGTKVAFASLGDVSEINVINVNGTDKTNFGPGEKPVWQPVTTSLPQPPTYSIRVHIKDDQGADWPGLPVTMTGTQTGTKGALSGGVLFWDLPAGGSYTFMSFQAPLISSPASVTFDNLSADQTVTFVLSPPAEEKATQTITFNALANKTYRDAPFTVSAWSTSGLPVGFSILSGPATVSGNTVTITGAGTVMVRASQSGNGEYDVSPNVDRPFEVAKATPLVTWNHPEDIAQGTLLGTIQLNANTSVPGSFAYTPGAGTVLNVGDGQSLSVTLNPNDGANYNSASASVNINVKACQAVQGSTFSANHTVVAAGVNVVLSWDVPNATTITIGGVPGSFGGTGTVAVTPASSTTYTLTSSGATPCSSINLSASVTVAACASSGESTFNASGYSVPSTTPVLLNWSVPQSSGIAITSERYCQYGGGCPGEQPVTTNSSVTGSVQIYPTESSHFYLRSTNSAFGCTEILKTIMINVLQDPASPCLGGAIFHASSNPVAIGSSTILHWNIPDGIRVFLRDSDGNDYGMFYGSTNSVEVAPTGETTYYLNVVTSRSGSCGVFELNTKVTVEEQGIGFGAGTLRRWQQWDSSIPITGQSQLEMHLTPTKLTLTERI